MSITDFSADKDVIQIKSSVINLPHTFGSLFTGIGGLDLGLMRSGWQCRWQVEIDPFCRKILTKHWPDIPKLTDIKTLEGNELEYVDLIAGGTPCQPVSQIGRKRGIADERWLWPEFCRLVCQLRPPLVLLENVPGLLVRGMGNILADLAALGYDALWEVFSAREQGACHQRNRLFIIAYPAGSGLERYWLPDRKLANHFAPVTQKTLLSDSAVICHRNGIPNYVDQIRGYGNAVCPPVGELIGRSVLLA